MGFSVDTIRRDIDALAKTGSILKMKRGAMARAQIHKGLDHQLPESKITSRILAHKAASIVKSRQTVVFDDGNLPLLIAGFLPRDIHLTLITHSFAIASLTFEFPNVKLIFAGGTAAKDSRITTGSDVLKKYNSLHGDLSFLNARYLHLDFGVSDPEVEEAEVKACISSMSDQLVVTAAPESLNSISTKHVCSINRIDYLAIDIDQHNPILEPYRMAGVAHL